MELLIEVINGRLSCGGSSGSVLDGTIGSEQAREGKDFLVHRRG